MGFFFKDLVFNFLSVRSFCIKFKKMKSKKTKISIIVLIVLTVLGLIIGIVYHEKNQSNASSTTTPPTPRSPPVTTGGLAKLPKWATAYQATAAHVNCFGDSTTFGAGTTSPYFKTNSYPSQLATLLNATTDSDFGWSDTGTFADSRVVLSGNIAPYRKITNDAFLVGGPPFQFLDTTAKIVVTPAGTQYNAVKIYWCTGPGFGSLSVTNNGTTTILAGNTASGVPATFKSQSVPFSGTSFTLTLATGSGTSGNPAFLAGFDMQTPTKTSIVRNNGAPGSRVVEWNSSNFISGNVSVAKEIPLIDSDLNIVMLGINDWLQGTAIPTFNANLTSIIAQSKLNSNADTLLITPIPTKATTIPAATQMNYVNEIIKVASASNVAVLDFFSIMGSYESNPGLYDDDKHFNSSGYAKLAKAVMQYIST